MHPSIRRFYARAQPNFSKVLLVESGPRDVCEQVLRLLYTQKTPAQLDLLTCYPTPPAAFLPHCGTVYSVHDRAVRENRSRFIAKLASAGYGVLAIVCAGSPVLQKWKWALALRSPARIVIFNEYMGYFSVDIWNLRSAEKMLAKRLNPFEGKDWDLHEALLAAAATLAVAPFTLAYLAIYSARTHLRRRARLKRAAS
ncbi:MAG: hypothetical protein JO061_02985 [Acidobacteriaceae bacterium]|nr:hypothetical protein [Acidobacteriaceae bacterium]